MIQIVTSLDPLGAVQNRVPGEVDTHRVQQLVQHSALQLPCTIDQAAVPAHT
jgi:hypothetical protein